MTRRPPNPRPWLRRLAESPLVLFVLVLVVAAFGRAVWVARGRVAVVGSERAALASQADELGAREADLTSRLAALGTAEGVEAAVRQKFAVVKPGERVITVVPPKELPPAPPAPKTWWQKLWEIFQ